MSLVCHQVRLRVEQASLRVGSSVGGAVQVGSAFFFFFRVLQDSFCQSPLLSHFKRASQTRSSLDLVLLLYIFQCIS
jgi:hypothetical protein